MPGLAVSQRGVELLDDPRADPAVVRASLRHIARANRWFGGSAAVRWGLARILEGVPRGSRFTLLDIGTGMGDLPLAAARWALRRGITIVPLGLERSPTAAALARSAGVPTMLADAGAPPLGSESVDILLLSQVAHHFDSESVISLLRAADELARHGVIVADLRRSPIAEGAFAIGSRVLGFDSITRADGRTSIRRGYTRAELAALLNRAGVRAEVRRRPGWRLVGVWRAADAGRARTA